MAQFQPDHNQPRPDLDEDRLQRGLDGMERAADRVRGFSLARYKPSWLRWPRFIRRWYGALPEQVRYRISVLSGFVQTGFLVIALTLGIALVFKALTNQTIFEPSSAGDVFARVDTPQDVSYTMETFRQKPIDGDLSEHHTLSIVGVNPDKKLLQAQVSGIALSPFRMVANGKTLQMAFLDNPDKPYDLGPAPGADVLAPIFGHDLKPVAGKLVDNKATVRNQRAWLLTWRPTSQLLLKMMNAKLFALENSDVKAISQGRFSVDYASATVIRRNYMLARLDTRIRIPDPKPGAQPAIMRILVSYQSQNTGNLDSLR